MKIDREKGGQIKFGMERINQRLDIVYLLNKLVELDKLKYLLLDKH